MAGLLEEKTSWYPERAAWVVFPPGAPRNHVLVGRYCPLRRKMTVAGRQEAVLSGKVALTARSPSVSARQVVAGGASPWLEKLIERALHQQPRTVVSKLA